MGFVDVCGSAARALARSLARFYYPQIAVDGAARLPREGPVLLAANHPNSLLDPVLLGIAIGRPVRLLAKAPLFEVPVFGPALRALGMIPAFRGRDNPRDVTKNLESFARAAEALAAGSVVGIFPEGKSHDDLQVALVRSGAARLAIQGVAAGARPLPLVPIGLNYERKEGFRTAVWIRVGEPIDVAAWLAAHPDDEHRAMRTLTAELDARLKQVVIHLTDTSWLPLLHEVEGLLPPPRRRDALTILRLRKRVADAINREQSTDPAAVAPLIDRIRAHGARRERAGLPPRARFFRDPLPRRLLVLGRDAVGLVMVTAIGLAGLLHHAVPHVLTRLTAGRFEEPGRMTLALYRLLIGLPLHLLWYAAAGWFLLRYFQPWVAVAWLCAMPVAGLLAVDAVRRWRTLAPVWWAEVRLWFRRDEARALRASHAALAAELARLAARYPENGDDAPARPRVFRPPLWLNLTLAGATAALLVLVGGWLLRDRPIELWRTDAPALHERPPGELAAELAADERGLRATLDGLAALEARYRDFEQALNRGERSYYRPDDEDEIRRMLVTFLSFRVALLRTVWKYQRYDQLTAEPLRLRALLLHYAAAAVVYDYSARFVLAFEGKDLAQRKLNEPEPRWDLPAGSYDRIRSNLANLSHRRWLEAGWRNYRATVPLWSAHGLGPDGPEPYARFHAAIGTAAINTAGVSERLLRYKLATAASDVTGVAGDGYYRASAALSTLIGDARLRAPRQGQALVTPELLERLRPLLRPGDILIERRNWYVSNAFLPGYWPHAALYVGTAEDLRALGLASDPRVAPHLPAFGARDAANHPFAVVEAVSEGVIFTSLEHSAGEADAVVVLRPRLPPEAIREAIARAFSHAGKPYDFEFDFFSSDKLVCTEVVHRAYAGQIEFPLVEILGRRTLPAIEIVRHWSAAPDEGPLEFIALLDGDEAAGVCHWSDAATLRASLERPALTWLN